MLSNNQVVSLRVKCPVCKKEETIKKLLDKARNGDIQAAKEILDRTVGKPKQINEGVSTLALPLIESIQDIKEASNTLIQSVAKGELDPSSAALLSSILEQHRRNIESNNLELRIEALEKELDT